ncbi:helix-turn-helix domain-containing protein [Streptomyces sp. S1D4-11]|nr:helix-turn-helix domain-containing protein [Streptomyces sp. S1D4-11]QIY96967.1 helix-turn-helix domain-containing protein [Streptomyces sp. S1D4-11]
MSEWTREAVEALGPTTDVPTTAAIFGVNKDTVYAQIRRGEWTATRVLPLGRKIRIPTRDLIALLYAPEPAVQVSPAVPSQCQHPEYPQVTPMESQSQCGCRVGESAVIRPLRGA